MAQNHSKMSYIEILGYGLVMSKICNFLVCLPYPNEFLKMGKRTNVIIPKVRQITTIYCQKRQDFVSGATTSLQHTNFASSPLTRKPVCRKSVARSNSPANSSRS